MIHMAALLVCGALQVSVPVSSGPLKTEMIGDHVFVQVTVNGVKGNFIVETGAGVVVLTNSFASKLKLNMGAEINVGGGGSGSEKGRLTSIDSLQVGKSSLANVQGLVMDMKGVQQRKGMPIDGLLGTNVLSKFAVDVDYEGNQLQLFAPDDFHYSGSAVGVPFTTQIGHIQFPATVKHLGIEVSGTLTLDMGAAMSALLSDQWKKGYGDPMQITPTAIRTSTGIGGTQTTKIFRCDSMTLGGTVVKGVPAGFQTDGGGFLSTTPTLGLVGNTLLRQFHLYLDFPNKKVYFAPNHSYGSKIPFDCSGIALTTDDKGIVVDTISPGSAADQAGVKAGDRLLSVDGKVMKLWEISALFMTPDQVHKVKIERDGKPMEISLTTRTQI